MQHQKLLIKATSYSPKSTGNIPRFKNGKLKKINKNSLTFRINKTRKIIKPLNGILWTKEIGEQRKVTIYNT